MYIYRSIDLYIFIYIYTYIYTHIAGLGSKFCREIRECSHRVERINSQQID